MRVAKDDGAGIVFRHSEQVLTHALPAQARLFADAHGKIALRHPFDEQVKICRQGKVIIAEQRPLPVAIGQDGGRPLAVNGGECFACGCVECDLVTAAADDVGEQIVAEVLKQGEAARNVVVEQVGRGEAQPGKVSGDSRESFDARGGQT